MTRGGQDRTDEIRAELARRGIAVDDDDLAAIVQSVAAHREGLERAREAVPGDPAVPHGFVPPAPADDAAPHAGG